MHPQPVPRIQLPMSFAKTFHPVQRTWPVESSENYSYDSVLEVERTKAAKYILVKLVVKIQNKIVEYRLQRFLEIQSSGKPNEIWHKHRRELLWVAIGEQVEQMGTVHVAGKEDIKKIGFGFEKCSFLQELRTLVGVSSNEKAAQHEEVTKSKASSTAGIYSNMIQNSTILI